jgi:hypothetical protein
VLVRLITCKSGAPTLNGSRSLSSKLTGLPTFRIISTCMFQEVKIKKANQLLYMHKLKDLNKNGRFFTLIKLLRQRPRDSMRSSDSISTDHSTLSQSFHSTELQKALEPTTLLSRDGERMFLLNSGTSMRSQRPLEATSGRTMQWTSKATEEATT